MVGIDVLHDSVVVLAGDSVGEGGTCIQWAKVKGSVRNRVGRGGGTVADTWLMLHFIQALSMIPVLFSVHS